MELTIKLPEALRDFTREQIYQEWQALADRINSLILEKYEIPSERVYFSKRDLEENEVIWAWLFPQEENVNDIFASGYYFSFYYNGEAKVSFPDWRRPKIITWEEALKLFFEILQKEYLNFLKIKESLEKIKKAIAILE